MAVIGTMVVWAEQGEGQCFAATRAMDKVCGNAWSPLLETAGVDVCCLSMCTWQM